MRKIPAWRICLLRFLSFLFAVGIIAGVLCFSGKTYFDRSLDAMIDEEFAENGFLAEHPVFQMIGRQDTKQYMMDFFSAAVRKDDAGMEVLITRMVDLYARSAPEDLRLSLSRDPEKYDEKIRQLSAKVMNDDQFRDDLAVFVDTIHEKLGIRWVALEIVLYNTQLVTVSFALSAASLVLWFAFGGGSAGFVRAGLLPALVVSAVCAGILLLLSRMAAPVRLMDEEMKNVIAYFI